MVPSSSSELVLPRETIRTSRSSPATSSASTEPRAAQRRSRRGIRTGTNGQRRDAAVEEIAEPLAGTSEKTIGVSTISPSANAARHRPPREHASPASAGALSQLVVVHGATRAASNRVA
jgi:hypothetical protein